MYSILLVEDEKLELETLRDYVDWKKLDIGPVYTARNGKRAMECMEEYAPDIVITDVQMPVMNGVQFAKQLIEKGYTPKIVFLTGYDDFEYVKAAFQVQAVDYLLKPFMIEDIEACMEKVKKELEKEKIETWSKKYAFGQVLQAFLSGEITEETMKEYCRALLKREVSKIRFGIGAICSQCSDEELNAVRQEFPEVFYIYRQREMSILILRDYVSPGDALARVAGFLQENFQKKNTILYCERQCDVERLRKMMDVLCRFTDFMFYQEPGTCLAVETASENMKIMEGKADGHIKQERFRNLRDALGKGEREQVYEICHKCFEDIYGYPKNIAIREIYSVYLYLKDHLVEEDNSLKLWMEDYDSIREEDILEVESCKELKTWIENYIEKNISFFGKQKENPNYYAIIQTKTYLQKHCTENVGIEKLSRQIGLSPNYLRSLFKEVTGKTILEYSIELRMEKAAELLKNKSLKIKEVSAAVGYENVSYFGMLFQRKYGVTPNEYRKMV